MSDAQVELGERLRAFMEIIVAEARSNPRLARRLRQALDAATDEENTGRRNPRHHRRPSPILDPFALYEQGEDRLRHALAELDLDQLKDVVAGYGMDRARLALRWTTPGRLVELIVETVRTRAHKGDVFRT